MQGIQPTMFIKDHLFKDITNINVFILIIVLVMVMLIFCLAALVWCRNRQGVSKSDHSKRFCNNHHQNTNTNKIALSNRLEYGLFDDNIPNKQSSQTAGSSTCSRSCSDRGGVNSTSSNQSTSGISCSSGFSSNFKSSECVDHVKEQQLCYLHWQNEKFMDESSPISKITMMSNYLNHDGQLMKANYLTNKNQLRTKLEQDQARLSCYSDLISSSASTIQNRETPILIKPDYVYDIGSSPTTNVINIPICIENASDYFQMIQEGNKSAKQKIDDHCTFKLSTPSVINDSPDCCMPLNKLSSKCFDYRSNNYTSLLTTTTTSSRTQTKQQHAENSPKLLSFLPPNSNLNQNQTQRNQANSNLTVKDEFRFSEAVNNNGLVNLVFNQHEPLGVNSETNIENIEILKSDKQSIYEDIKNVSQDSTNLQENNNSKFQNNLTNCNESLVRLVNIINQNKSEQISNLYEATNDSSLISVSIDNYPNDGDYDEYVYDDHSNDFTTNDDDEVNVYKSNRLEDELYSNKNVLMHENRDKKIKFITTSKPPVGFRDPIENKSNCMITNNSNNLSNDSAMDPSLSSIYILHPVDTVQSRNLITKCNIISIDKNEKSDLIKT